ncbi:Sec-independent protein translocase protein TatB [Pelagibacteraceae bacterium]|nr:Sec-independent protein translocase protein TatB [Pelagibacteraceae bacterium]|tara:strand:+ start:1330 stop:1566 length:237 start_codon:yes stop_codon:yes gene_type:complete
MPQIGWFEIIIIVVLAILIIGPKDFPKILKKTGNWFRSVKSYFNEIQKDVNEIEDSIEDEISFDKDLIKIKNDDKKDE